MSTTIIHSEEFTRIVELCTNAVVKSVNLIQQDDRRNKVLEFIVSTILQQRPYTLLTETSSNRMGTMVFADEYVRDFILQTSFYFYATVGNDSKLIDAMQDAIVSSFTPANNGTGTAIFQISSEIQSKIPSADEAKRVLKHNRWMMIIMLLFFVELPDAK